MYPCAHRQDADEDEAEAEAALNEDIELAAHNLNQDIWMVLPFWNIAWGAVQHDVARAEYLAVRECVDLACREVRVELNHIEEERQMMINTLDYLMEHLVDAFCDYSMCNIQLVGQFLSGQEEDRFWLRCDDVEDARASWVQGKGQGRG